MTEQAAQRYRRPESVLVIVHTAARECLLLERVDPAGFWQSVTGSLEWGEAPADAARRELGEETGIDWRAPARLRDAGITQRFPILPEWRSRFEPGVDENVEHLWYLELPERRAATLNAAEHRAYRWLPLERAIETAGSWTDREGLERLRSNRW